MSAAAVALPATPAAAHGNKPDAAIPAAGEQLTELPDRVSLAFDEPVRQSGSAISVLDPAGRQIAVGAPVVTGMSVTVPLSDSEYRGTYKVAYRVIFEDGAGSESRYEFDVTEGVDAAAADSSPASNAAASTPAGPAPASASTPAVPAPVASSTLTNADLVAAEPADPDEPASGRNWALVVLLAVAGGVLLAFSLLTPTRRKP